MYFSPYHISKMKPIFLIVAISAFARTYACDVCGCSASNQYLGLLPQYQWNFFGFQSQYSKFSSIHESAYSGKPDEHANDQYNTLQVWGRYNIGRHYQVFAFIPYNYNIHNENKTTSVTSGIGDISLLATRILANKDRKDWRFALSAGLGLKLPTGKYVGISTLDREGLPNLQPGSGSWDFIGNANYTVSYKKTGINLDATSTITSPNKDNFKYGNRYGTGITAFYSLMIHKLSVAPMAGIRYEYTLHDYDNYSKKWLNEESGGYLSYGTVGVQAYFKKVGLRLSYQLPIGQNFASGNVTAKQKLESGIFLLF